MIVFVPMAFELLLLGMIGYLLHLQQLESLEEDRARSVVAECSAISSNVVKNAALLFGGLLGGLDAANLSEQLRKSSDVFEVSEKNLRQRITTNSQAQAFEKVEVDMHEIKLLLSQSNSGIDSLAWTARARRLRPLVVRIESSLQSLIKAETSSLDKLHNHNLLLQRLLEITCWSAFAVSILVAFALLMYFQKSITARVETLKRNSSRLSVGELLLPELTGNDEFVELDAAFREMADKLQKASVQRKELLQMVAHDLRSPLSAMLVTLQIIETGKRGTMTEQLSQDVALLSNSAERLVRLIGDLLSAEALEAGDLSLEKKRCSLVGLISRAADAVEPLSLSKRISIDLPKDAPMVFVDDERIVQVLVNLLSNAIKFSPPDSKITVLCADTMNGDKSRWSEVSIIDEGRGIPKDKSGELFQRFFQANVEDRKQGSGLGLAICKALVAAHGGDIGCENNKQAGSRFWFLLPTVSETQA